MRRPLGAARASCRRLHPLAARRFGARRAGPPGQGGGGRGPTCSAGAPGCGAEARHCPEDPRPARGAR
eukprot:2724352-Pyramimonas_sp.AAC.1